MVVLPYGCAPLWLCCAALTDETLPLMHPDAATNFKVTGIMNFDGTK